MLRKLPIALLLALLLSLPGVAALAEVRIATWNVMRMTEDNKSFPAMVSIASHFDFLALQEVMSEGAVSRLQRKLMDATGEEWNAMVSHEVGRGSYKERYAFVWRESKIDYLDGAAIYLDDRDFFEREPLSARFKAVGEDFSFIAATIHVIYGQDKARREPELAALRAYWHWLADSWPEEPIFLMGDFNMAPEEEAWRHVLEVARPAVVDGATTLSTKEGQYANLYDNIWFPRGFESDVLRSGILRYPEIIQWSHEKSRKHVSDHAPVYLEVGRVTAMSQQPLPDYDPEEVYVSSSLFQDEDAQWDRPSILANENSGIYHWPGCPGYNSTSPANAVGFDSRQDAEDAGYRAARNC